MLRYRWLIDFGTIFSIGLLSGLMLAGLVGGSFLESVRDWQTLIAGALAVAAAYLTIAEMRRAAIAEQERYAAAVAERQAQERIWAERAIKSLRVTLALTISRCEEVTAADPISEENAIKAVGNLLSLAGSVTRTMSSRAMREASSLFAPEDEGTFADATEFGPALKEIAELLKECVSTKQGEAIQQCDELLKTRTRMGAVWLTDILAALDRIAGRYAIDKGLMAIPLLLETARATRTRMSQVNASPGL